MKDTLAPDNFYTPQWVKDAVAEAQETVSRFDGIPDCDDASCGRCHHCYIIFRQRLRVDGGKGE